MQSQELSTHRKVMLWLSKSDVCNPSRILAYAAIGMKHPSTEHPSTIKSVKSVLSLIDAVPEVSESFEPVKSISKEWAAFLNNLSKIDTILKKETSSAVNDNNAPKTLEFLEKMYK